MAEEKDVAFINAYCLMCNSPMKDDAQNCCECLRRTLEKNEIKKEKKPIKKSVKKTTRKSEVFTVSDEKVFTVKNEDIKTLGEVLNVKKFDDYPKQLTDTFVCDECRGHFKGSEIELKPFGNNFNMANPMMSLRLVNATNGEIVATSNTGALNKDHDYYTLCCPICHATHLWGMTAIDPRKVFAVK